MQYRWVRNAQELVKQRRGNPWLEDLHHMARCLVSIITNHQIVSADAYQPTANVGTTDLCVKWCGVGIVDTREGAIWSAKKGTWRNDLTNDQELNTAIPVIKTKGARG